MLTSVHSRAEVNWLSTFNNFIENLCPVRLRSKLPDAMKTSHLSTI